MRVPGFIVTLMVAALVALTSASASERPPFDPHAALMALMFTKCAACPTESIATWTCPTCKDLLFVTNVTVITNDTVGALSYVAYNRLTSQIVVAFRPSRNLVNWIEDYDFTPVVYPHCANVTAAPIPMPSRSAQPSPQEHDAPKFATSCTVARGDLEAYWPIRAQVIAAVRSLVAQYPLATVMVVGWSLGGAQATHAAVDLTYVLPQTRKVNCASSSSATCLVSPVAHLVTFGSARVGSPVFVKWASTLLFKNNAVTSYRIVHNSDLVPKMPFREAAYLHIEREIWLPYGGFVNSTSGSSNPPTPVPADAMAYKECDDSDVAEDPMCSGAVPLENVVVSDHDEAFGIYLGCS